LHIKKAEAEWEKGEGGGKEGEGGELITMNSLFSIFGGVVRREGFKHKLCVMFFLFATNAEAEDVVVCSLDSVARLTGVQ
jgi:hypothetical protein